MYRTYEKRKTLRAVRPTVNGPPSTFRYEEPYGLYKVKCVLRNLLHGPPPVMAFGDWLDMDKVEQNAKYPWFMEEWRDIALSYARAYVEVLDELREPQESDDGR